MQVRLENMQHPSLVEELVSPEESRGSRSEEKGGRGEKEGGGSFPLLRQNLDSVYLRFLSQGRAVRVL